MPPRKPNLGDAARQELTPEEEGAMDVVLLGGGELAHPGDFEEDEEAPKTLH